MNVIDYYREFLKKENLDLKEVSIDKLIIDESIMRCAPSVKHIYLNDLSNFITITSWIDDTCEYYVNDSLVDRDEYIMIYTDVYLSGNKYTVLLTNKDVTTFLNVFIYNEDSLFIFVHYMIDNISKLINWINIDRLTNLVNEASSYIYFMLSKIDNEKFLTSTWQDDYNAECEYILTIPSEFNESITSDKLNIFYRLQKDINHFLFFDKDDDIRHQYDIVYIYNGDVLEPIYINYSNKERILSTSPKGIIIHTVFYLPIDKDRSLFILRYFQKPNRIFMFTKSGKLIDRIIYSKFSEFKTLFDLIHRTDIYDFLKKVDMFRNDTYKQYIEMPF